MASCSQQVIWTALPNGVGRKGPQVSVVVSPRLTIDDALSAPLARFPDRLDWPKIVAKSRFTVRLGNQTIPAEPISKPESRIWQAIFGKETVVLDHAFEDLSDRAVISYSVADMEARLRDVYTRFAGDPSGDLPEPEDVRDALHPFAIAPHGPGLLKTLSGPGGKGFLGELHRAGLADLGLFHAYHAPADETPGPRPTPRDAKAVIEGIDFHKLVAALGQYAALLRASGLVIDLALGKPLRAADAHVRRQARSGRSLGPRGLAEGAPRRRHVRPGRGCDQRRAPSGIHARLGSRTDPCGAAPAGRAGPGLRPARAGARRDRCGAVADLALPCREHGGAVAGGRLDRGIRRRLGPARRRLAEHPRVPTGADRARHAGGDDRPYRAACVRRHTIPARDLSPEGYQSVRRVLSARHSRRARARLGGLGPGRRARPERQPAPAAQDRPHGAGLRLAAQRRCDPQSKLAPVRLAGLLGPALVRDRLRRDAGRDSARGRPRHCGIRAGCRSGQPLGRRSDLETRQSRRQDRDLGTGHGGVSVQGHAR